MDLAVIITGSEANLGVMRQARMLGNQSLIVGVLDGLHTMITARTA